MPRYQQIARQLKTAIERGELQPGARLPSSRTWSQELGISRSTVENAYAELVAQGWLERRGKRERLSAHSCSRNRRSANRWSLPEKVQSLSPFRWGFPR